MTAPPDPRGARARQTHYWQVRNARTRALAAIAPAEVWHIKAGHPGGAYSDAGQGPTDVHTPTLLTRTTSGRHPAERYRGGCLACPWEGPERSGGRAKNQAVEDAHDHAVPGWRALPLFPTSWGRMAPAARDRARRIIDAHIPPNWTGHGAPLLVRARAREEHQPPHPGRPRYELRLTATDERERGTRAQQGDLF